MAKGRDWLVVRRAKAILWIAGPGFLIVQGIIIPIMIFGKTVADDPKFIGGFLASIIATSIWTAYLSKSKRVRNTYGGSKNARESTET